MRKPLVRILFGGIFICVLFFFLSLFRINHVEVEPSNLSVVLDPAQLPTNLLLFPTEKIRHLLLSTYPRIKDVQFIKLFPHTLKVRVEERNPIAFIDNQNKLLAVDSEGILFSYPENDSLPHLELPMEVMTPGERAQGKGFDTTLAFVEKLSHDEAIDRIVLSTDGTLQVSMKDLTVLLLAGAEGSSKADTLQALLKGFRMKGSVPHLIDLRFSKPIVTP
jgi:cell division protein FtsQ